MHWSYCSLAQNHRYACFDVVGEMLILRRVEHCRDSACHGVWPCHFMKMLNFAFNSARHLCREAAEACGLPALIARFMGSTWGPSGADRTQVGPMLAPWTLLSGWCYMRWYLQIGNKSAWPKGSYIPWIIIANTRIVPVSMNVRKCKYILM